MIRPKNKYVKGRPFLAIIGYSCKGLSALSNLNKQIILTSEIGSSGETCKAMLEYFSAHRPLFGLLENVPEMAKPERESTNVRYIHSRFREIGYAMSEDTFCNSEYHLPQKGKRAFAIVMDCRLLGVTEDEALDSTDLILSNQHKRHDYE